MLFNSIEFALFLPVVFALYWFVFKSVSSQNILLLVASYFFYGWWDWRFLSLIAFSSALDYLIGLRLSKTEEERTRKLLLYTSLAVNLGFLGVFKYYNFFAQSFADAFTLFGQSIDPLRLQIILPVGISFYTFQTLSYTIDVYRKQLEPAKNMVSFFAFVSFFPQLVAGPIERASNLLPQFYQERKFSYTQSVDGLRQILWGLFKKIVVADNCAVVANKIFENYTDYSGSTLLLGAVLFAFQIYGDFSGYSDIAIGTSRLFGFNLKKNFAFPYFSRDIAEFWRRWHISLSTWFRDYLYIPLGGSKGSMFQKVRNIFIIFLVSGLWHGANWTFLAWGGLNALYFLPLLFLNRNRQHIEIVANNKIFPSLIEAFQIVSTFSLTTIAWVFFRAKSIEDGIGYLKAMFSFSLFSIPDLVPSTTLSAILILLLFEWLQRDKDYGLSLNPQTTNVIFRWTIYVFLGLIIFIFGGIQQEFIYFQF